MEEGRLFASVIIYLVEETPEMFEVRFILVFCGH